MLKIMSSKFYCSRLCLQMFKIMFCKVQDYVLYLAFCRMQAARQITSRICRLVQNYAKGKLKTPAASTYDQFRGTCCGSVRAAWHCPVLSNYFNWFRRWANGAKLFLLTLRESLYHLQLGQRQTPFGAHLGCMGLSPSYFFPHLSQDGNWQCLQRSARFCAALRLAQSFSHLGFPQDLQVGPQCQDLRDLMSEAGV